MSDPNSTTKNRQTMLIVGVIGGIVALMAAGMFMFDDSGPTAKATKPQTVAITPPGALSDRDAWRAHQAARETRNEDEIKRMKDEQKRADDRNDKAEKEIAELKKLIGRDVPTGRGAVTVPGQTGALNGSLPEGGSRDGGSSPVDGPASKTAPVLGRPDGSRPQPGPPGSTLNTPIRQAAVPKRELEIIKFGNGPGGSTATLGGRPGGKTEQLGFPNSDEARKFAQTKGRSGSGTDVEFIPAGSFVRVAMLNGLDAPTGGNAQSNPLAVAFHVLDPANLPNRHRLDIKDCRIMGSAWGELSSERTMVRLETLACILGDGQTVEMPIKGQANGEDGKAGLRGRLVSKQGQLLANALMGGALSGIGRAFQASATTQSSSGLGVTQTIDPDRVTSAAIGGGFSQAGNMLAEYYLKAADKLFPVIETDGGRVIELLITKGATYSGDVNLQTQHRALLQRSGSNTRYQDED